MALRGIFPLLLLWLVPALRAQPVTAEDFLERARDHFEKRRFLNTLDSLRVVLELTEAADARVEPTKLEAEILAAHALSALGRSEEAANMYERAVAHGYQDKSALAYLGKYFASHGQWPRAREYLSRYFLSDKSDSETHIGYAVVLARLRERSRAKDVLAAIEPTTASKKIAECELLEKQRKLREAYACFREYRNSHPDSEVGYLALYRIAKQLNDRGKALDSAQNLYWLFGDDPRYAWPLIEVRLAERKFYEARLLLEEVVQIQGTNSDAARLLANLQRDAGDAAKKPLRASPKELRILGEISR